MATHGNVEILGTRIHTYKLGSLHYRDWSKFRNGLKAKLGNCRVSHARFPGSYCRVFGVVSRLSRPNSDESRQRRREKGESERKGRLRNPDASATRYITRLCLFLSVVFSFSLSTQWQIHEYILYQWKMRCFEIQIVYLRWWHTEGLARSAKVSHESEKLVENSLSASLLSAWSTRVSKCWRVLPYLRTVKLRW